MRKTNLVFVLFGTLIMAYILENVGALLKAPGSELGILNLELAFNPEQATAIHQNWIYTYANGLTRVEIATRHTWLDFVFIIFYSFFLLFWCKSISEMFTGWAASLGKFAATASIYAGFFDIIENLGLLAMLNGYTGGIVPLLTGIFSSIKWILVIFALLYLIVFGAASLFTKNKNNAP